MSQQVCSPSLPDRRIPIIQTGGTAADAYLIEGEANPPPGAYTVAFKLPQRLHVFGCTCCTPRGPAATALAAMFRARATGAAPFFNRVILQASAAGIAAVADAVNADAVTAARYVLFK